MPYLERPGAKIWWETMGTGSPLMIVQGLGYNIQASWRLLPELSTRHTLLLLDNRGVGRSDVPKELFTIADMAADAAAVIEAADLGAVHLIGFSMGGLIAQELSLTRPKLIRSLTLGCTSPGGKDAVLLTKETAELLGELDKLPAPEAARKAAPVVYAQATPASAVEADIDARMVYPTSRVGYGMQLAAVARYGGASARLADLDCPVLVLHGTADRLVPPENAAVLKKAIPHAVVHLIPDAGHIFTTDATEAVLEAVLGFLDEQDTAPSFPRPAPVHSTMQDSFALSVSAILRQVETLHADVQLSVFDGQSVRHIRYADVAERIYRLSGALLGARVKKGHRVGTFMWNSQAHLEAYFAVPAAGAVLHTINVRLPAEQVGHIIDHAQDSVLLVDASLWDTLAPVLGGRPTVRLIVIAGSVDLTAARKAVDVEVIDYEQFLAAATPATVDIDDDRSPAAMCYTSGTTGDPKGVVYSHRSVYLHALANLTAAGFGISDRDRMLQAVPMFHANGWGFPYAAWLAGASLILPDRYVQPELLTPLIASERPTLSGGVPTVWRGVFDYAQDFELDITSLRVISCAGSAVPESLLRDYQSLGINLYQAWGMTETSPLAAIARPPAVTRGRDEWYWRTRTGRPVPGVETRLADEDGTVLPNDGTSVGELQVRGPWVAASYVDGVSGSSFDAGWLRTGDLGTIDDTGAMKITDRLKDLIKSGGEWISSTELEDRLVSHPAVVEAAVIAVPDPKWQERPLAVVQLRPDVPVSEAELRNHLSHHLASWQLPEHWAVVAAIPKTGAGKIDKQQLRRSYASGELAVTTVPRS
ncbi:MAG: long-chain-fatty-acid--CoA ligase [Microlunatus sp.]|nr:long-chain-fatty-acid--CoA ligase [Microlunatus sp.]